MGEFEFDDSETAEGTNWLNIAWNLPKGRDLREKIAKLRKEIQEQENSVQSCRQMLEQARADIVFNKEEHRAAQENIVTLKDQSKVMEKVLKESEIVVAELKPIIQQLGKSDLDKLRRMPDPAPTIRRTIELLHLIVNAEHVDWRRPIEWERHCKKTLSRSDLIPLLLDFDPTPLMAKPQVLAHIDLCFLGGNAYEGLPDASSVKQLRLSGGMEGPSPASPLIRRSSSSPVNPLMPLRKRASMSALDGSRQVLTEEMVSYSSQTLVSIFRWCVCQVRLSALKRSMDPVLNASECLQTKLHNEMERQRRARGNELLAAENERVFEEKLRQKEAELAELTKRMNELTQQVHELVNKAAEFKKDEERERDRHA